MQTTNSTPDIATLLQRQNELLEQIAKASKGTSKATTASLGLSQRQGRLISLGLLWGIILAILLHMAMQTALANIADTRLGQALGLEAPAQSGNVGNGTDRPLKKGDTLGDWIVTSGMGPRQSPGGVGSTNHAGVDLAHKAGPSQTMGAPLVAPFPTLVVCSQSGGGGIGATIDGPEVRLRMLHLSQCKPGRVEAGQVIGNVGNTGSATTGPHLHLEQYEQGKLVNPTEKWAAAVLGIQLAGDSGNTSLDALRRAIIGKESGGNFKAINPHSGALGYGQIMPSNLPSWSKAALGREVGRDEFLNNPDIQIAIINHRLGLYLQEETGKGFDHDTAIRRVASRWYSGRAHLYNNTRPQRYGAGRYPSINDYTLDVLAKYKAEKGG